MKRDDDFPLTVGCLLQAAAIVCILVFALVCAPSGEDHSVSALRAFLGWLL